MQPVEHGQAEDLGFFSGGGEMGALIRALDWSKTPLGPVEAWSSSLRTTLSTMLANRFPHLLWWGPDYVQFYNDPYRPVLGTKHPKSMGQTGRECWPEIWHVIGPLVDTPFNGGPATWMEDICLEINRHGFIEECHFIIAYSPVPDESAPRGIGGVLATVNEITDEVVGKRRIGILRDLGARVAEAKTAEDSCAIAAETLSNHPHDLPFALLYLVDPDGLRARLAGASGVGMGGPASPSEVDLNGGSASPWAAALTGVARTGAMQVVEDLGAHLPIVPRGPWSDPPHTAVAVPVKSNIAHQLAGVLVAGVSARLTFDDLYRAFFELAAAQIATAIANARTYEEERRRAEALAEIDRAKTLFFSNVSHEFRTPLTLMLGPLEDALATGGLSVVERERIGVAHRSSLRLLKLVNTLLDFSRIEAGRAQASYEPTDLAALTADLASNFRSACERAGLALVVDCPPLPAPVHVDRDMWEKIVLNLVSNAFKFTHRGEIAVTLRPAGDAVELAVRDTGVGIAEAELPRIFERFHRVEGARGRSHEGSGIGLSLVQELVKLHGGAICVDSVEGRGTTFTVSIPAGSAHLPADRIGAERTLESTAVGASAFVEEALRWLPDQGLGGRGAAPAAEIAAIPPIRPLGSASAPDNAPARILWVDDNADMRDYVSRLLSGRYEVQAVAEGTAALAAARANPPNLVLADAMMPGLDGFDLLRALRADPRTRAVPVMILSARAGEESRLEGLGAGANDYLIKPFSARELMARVEAQLAAARLRQEIARVEEFNRQIIQSSRDCIKVLDLEGRLLSINDPGLLSLELTDAAAVIGASYVDLWHGADRAAAQAAIERGQAGGTGHFTAFYRTPSGKDTWWDEMVTPILDAGGRPERLLVISRDITERKRAEDHRDMLIAELNHRVKNTLATVQSIAAQTLRGGASLIAEREFQARLLALAKVHDLLTADRWEGTSLRDLVYGTLAPYDPGGNARFAVLGPDVRLRPKTALALGMALHELATNAAKYGALSNEIGRVRIAWDVERAEARGRLRLNWVERGGPSVAPSPRKGFGSRLIERGLPLDLGGEARVNFAPAGLEFTIDLPLAPGVEDTV